MAVLLVSVALFLLYRVLIIQLHSSPSFCASEIMGLRRSTCRWLLTEKGPGTRGIELGQEYRNGLQKNRDGTDRGSG